MDGLRAAGMGIVLGLGSLIVGEAFGQGGAGRGTPVVRWIGQDGKDFVGPHNRVEPSDVQDVHIAIAGLDPRREVTFVDLLAVGGDPSQWQYNADSFSWKAALVREKGSPRADLYIEPSTFTAPRKHEMTIRYDDGREHKLTIQGRKVDPGLRMPGAEMKATWAGQDGRDAVGPGASVGPDGLQDVHIRLTGVSKAVPIKAIRIDGPEGAKWESHINPEMLPACEFRMDPAKPGEGDLFFQPTRDLGGKSIAIRFLYANDTGDRATVASRRIDPKRRMPDLPAASVRMAEARAKWLGQDGADVVGPGDVHVAISGLDAPRDLAGAVLTDSSRGSWVFQAPGNDQLKSSTEWGGAEALAVRPGATSGSFDLYFPPYRDESDATFTLRMIARDGRSTFARFPGGRCDPDKRLPAPDASRRAAKPGDDLQKLVDQGGTVSLAPGTYRLTRPLTLNKPVVLTAAPGATLVFSHPAGEPPWTAAIKIHKGRTTLEGFAIRFEGAIRWDQQVGYGPAIIGTSDDRDSNPWERKTGIVIARLDIEGPASDDPSRWTDAVRVMRFTNANGGRVEGNRLLGGPIEFFNGPWSFVDNTFRGVPAKTRSNSSIAGHFVNDVVVRGNRVKAEPLGKVWRFLALTHMAWNATVEDNVVEGVGEMDDDGVPRVNAPEIMLTECYRIGYEGAVRAVSPDGLLIRIGERQGEPIRAGQVAAILTGPAAGTFRRLSQPIDQTTILLDAPIPKETTAVSIVDGMSGLRYAGNTVDIRGSSTSYGLILPGNQFGTVVENNHFLGGAEGLTATACASESPIHWGWSRCPAMGVVVRGNTFEDVREGLRVSVAHDPKHIRFSSGRVYMSATVEDNVIRWTDPFLRKTAAARAAGKSGDRPLLGVVVGEPHSRDPRELRVAAARNALDAPSGRRPGPSLVVRAAELNSQPTRDKNSELPRAETRPAPGATKGGGR
ncbi:hypothetical protein [Planctomyces sp. SH-PL62]|uniref:hypothetical protein n=1 Tax=Planctomyces sp. SH-PL62 TaxID=1636152 RepID=UPI00078E7FE7|nr:hypothetical protein [Planctomyces sp. SH-PL62]AMV37306.1 hypothetical protein VT85_07725 [Planctomyces sp. SH-PL62]